MASDEEEELIAGNEEEEKEMAGDEEEELIAGNEEEEKEMAGDEEEEEMAPDVVKEEEKEEMVGDVVKEEEMVGDGEEGEEIWQRLPPGILELVLAHLPLPALCRLRCVCRAWNRLSHQPWFLALRHRNEATKPYLFVTRYLSPVAYGDVWSAVDETHRRTCFLDLEDLHWYAIPASPSLPNDEVLRLLAVDDGLCVELSSLAELYKLAVRDPVAMTKREVPTAGVVCPVGESDPEVDALPVMVTVVDADASFKVFCMNRDSTGLHSGFFVYESRTASWRSLRAPPERLGLAGARFRSDRVLEESAVFFRGSLYAVFWYNDSNTNVVVSYSLETDSWREVLALDAENPKCPQLMVFRGRLFIALWNIPILQSPTPRVFEIREVLGDRLVARIPSEQLERVCGEKQFDFSYGFPLDSRSVVLISRRTGRVLRYDLGGAVASLPVHPLEMSQEFALKLREHSLYPHYRARISTLSMRNVLSSAPR